MNTQLYKYKVQLETFSDIIEFNEIADKLNNLNISVKIENKDGKKQGNAATIQNVLLTITWDEVYIISEYDVYTDFKKFIV